MIKFILLVIYLLVGFVPYFGASDKQAVQVLYLQIFNFLSILYLSYDLLKKERLKFDISFFSYFLFFVISILSIFVAENKTESLRIITDIFTYLVTIFIITNLLTPLNQKLKDNFLNIVIVVLFVEVFMVLLPFLYDISQQIIKFRSTSYSGTTGNINIAAFSILMKTPVLLYKMFNNNRINIQFIVYLIIYNMIGLSLISAIQSRAAILSLVLLNILLITYFILQFNNKVISRKILIRNIALISFTIFSNYGINKIIYSEATVFSRMETLASNEDDSIKQRKRYYTQSFNSIINHPFLGIGIGNWKLKGIEADLPNMKAYIVPYHSHNDFLEISAETGILGGLFYFSFFLVPLFFGVKKVVQFRFNSESSLTFYLGLVIIIYFLDSMFNFPFARPIQNIFLILATILILQNLDNKWLFKINFSKKTNYIILTLMILVSPVSLYSSIKLFKSSQEQFKLLGEYNFNKFNTSVEELNTYEMDYPNISGTTIPLKTFKGIYYLRSNSDSLIKESIQLFHQGKKANPYLPINDSYLSLAYTRIKNKDSALYYGKKAFYTQKKNLVHFTHYLYALNEVGDTLEMKKIYDEFKNYEYYGDAGSNIYLNLLVAEKKGEKADFYLQNINEELYYKDEKNKVNLYLLEYGIEELLKADEYYKSGETFFKNKEFKKAAESFEKAIEINPKETPYYENAALSYLQLSEYDKVFEYTDVVISRNKNTGKAYYINGIAHLEIGNNQKSCDEFKKAIINEFFVPQGVINLVCNN